MTHRMTTSSLDQFIMHFFTSSPFHFFTRFNDFTGPHLPKKRPTPGGFKLEVQHS